MVILLIILLPFFGSLWWASQWSFTFSWLSECPFGRPFEFGEQDGPPWSMGWRGALPCPNGHFRGHFTGHFGGYLNARLGAILVAICVPFWGPP